MQVKYIVHKGKMKKTYTKKQITKAIAYWESQLELMSEDNDEEPIETKTVNPGVSVKIYKPAELAGILRSDKTLLKKLVRLRENLYGEEATRWSELGRDLYLSPGNEKDVEKYLTGSDAAYVVIAYFNDLVPIGFLRSEFKESGELYLNEDCVDPKYRGLGAGTKMIRCMVEGAGQDGVHVFLCDIDVNNPASEKQVIRNGFKKFSTKFVLRV